MHTQHISKARFVVHPATFNGTAWTPTLYVIVCHYSIHAESQLANLKVTLLRKHKYDDAVRPCCDLRADR